MSLSGTESFIGSSEKNNKSLNDPQWLEHEVQAFKGVGTRSPQPLFDSTNGKMTHNEVIRGHKKFGPK